MASNINRDILKKLSEKTKNEENQKEFIMEILQAESKGLGWYMSFYKEKIEKFVEKEK